MTAKAYSHIDERLRQQTFVEKADAALWKYCCNRHREFWRLHGEKEKPRNPPKHYRDKDHGEVGWYFPAKWVSDFKTVQLIPQPLAGKNRLTPEERDAYVARILGKFTVSEQVSAREAERWQLPAGTIITPNEVTYPDASRESIEELRLRHGRYQHTPPRSAEQQNLEDMLRLAKRMAKPDAG